MPVIKSGKKFKKPVKRITKKQLRRNTAKHKPAVVVCKSSIAGNIL